MAFNGFYGQEKRPGGTLTKDATKKNGHQTCRRLQESAQEFVFWGYKEKVDNRLAELNNSQVPMIFRPAQNKCIVVEHVHGLGIRNQVGDQFRMALQNCLYWQATLATVDIHDCFEICCFCNFLCNARKNDCVRFVLPV